jgi:hypothetical protein
MPVDIGNPPRIFDINALFQFRGRSAGKTGVILKKRPKSVFHARTPKSPEAIISQ